jgi:hypothetical protein
MFLVQVLERKQVIRFFGISLILAPFFNHFAKMALLVEVPKRWTLSIMWQVFQTNHFSTQLLALASLLIGFMMLNGSVKAWRYALFLLGCYIVVQLTQFGATLKQSRVAVLFLLTNIGLFIFIADQLVWKVQSKAPKSDPTPKLKLETEPPQQNKTEMEAKSQPEPILEVDMGPRRVFDFREAVQRKAKSEVKMKWKDFGVWGVLSQVNPKGLVVKAVVDRLPFQIQDRQINLQLRDGTLIKSRFSHQDGKQYFFNFEDLSSDRIRNFNSWLKSLS